MNWQYKVMQVNGKLTPINDFESMTIGEQVREIWKDPMHTKHLLLPALQMEVNLYSSVIKKQGKTKPLMKSHTNNRFDRARPEQTDKGSGLNFVISGTDKKVSSFAKESGAYGYLWAEKTNGDRKTYPSFEQMMEGIFKWYNK